MGIGQVLISFVPVGSMYGRRSLFGMGCPAFGKPFGITSAVGRLRCCPARKSLNSPCRMPAVGTTPKRGSSAIVCRFHS